MKENHIVEAARAYSTLNAFAGVVALLEGGLVYCPESEKAAERIIQIAREEQGRMLQKYDREVILASREIPTKKGEG